MTPKTTQNIYKKIQQARVDLQNKNLKKTGKNQNISYYELSDFLPAINEINNKLGILTRFYIKKNIAYLQIIDGDDPEKIISFSSPTAEVELPRGQAIQGLGAKITYMRRYLLMMAYEIVESDYVDRQKQDGEELPQEFVDRLYACRDLESLNVEAKKIQSETKKRYQKSLLEAYTLKKTELSEIKEVVQK